MQALAVEFCLVGELRYFAMVLFHSVMPEGTTLVPLLPARNDKSSAYLCDGRLSLGRRRADRIRWRSMTAPENRW